LGDITWGVPVILGVLGPFAEERVGRPGKEDAEADGWTRLERCKPAARLSRDVLEGSGGLEAGKLGDWLSRLAEPMLSLMVGGREDCSPTKSLSLLRYFSFSFNVRSKSLLRPRIMALCFSTSLHSWVVCVEADCFSCSSFAMAASGEPAAAIRVGMSVGSSEMFDCERTMGWGAVDEESEDRVESIETVRCCCAIETFALR
jgi:hypothetical protein